MTSTTRFSPGVAMTFHRRHSRGSVGPSRWTSACVSSATLENLTVWLNCAGRWDWNSFATGLNHPP
ncbi:hypothetical protein ABTA61_19900, partial [Acinetobacter baumannii]